MRLLQACVGGFCAFSLLSTIATITLFVYCVGGFGEGDYVPFETWLALAFIAVSVPFYVWNAAIMYFLYLETAAASARELPAKGEGSGEGGGPPPWRRAACAVASVVLIIALTAALTVMSVLSDPLAFFTTFG